MIIDKIKNADIYYNLGEKIEKALRYLKEKDFSSMSDGKYEIYGNKIFAMVSRYETKPVNTGVWEAHKKYIDVQYIAEGTEKLGYAPVDILTVSEEYSEEKDIMFLNGEGSYIGAGKGAFLIFYPGDGHMPGLNPGDSKKNVLKVVVKVIAD